MLGYRSRALVLVTHARNGVSSLRSEVQTSTTEAIPKLGELGEIVQYQLEQVQLVVMLRLTGKVQRLQVVHVAIEPGTLEFRQW